MAKPIDRYIGLEWLLQKVKAAHKEAKEQAIDDLATLTGELGVTEMTSTMFGVEAGNLKYSKVRAKEVTEYNVCDAEELEDWINANTYTVFLFAKDHAEEFAKWVLENTGQPVDGVAVVKYKEPAKTGPAKLYGFDPKVVEAAFGDNIMEGANQLLLGDGE